MWEMLLPPLGSYMTEWDIATCITNSVYSSDTIQALFPSAQGFAEVGMSSKSKALKGIFFEQVG